MTETLLSTSNILLFGRIVEDLSTRVPATESVQAAATEELKKADLKGHGPIDTVNLASGNSVLVFHLDDEENGIYTVGNATADWTRKTNADQPEIREIVEVMGGAEHKGFWVRAQSKKKAFRFRKFSQKALGKNNFLAAQREGGIFARVYGFSFEGIYYDLPRPTLFLVHGPGELVTDPQPNRNAARAPTNPSLTGLGAADFQFSDELYVWSYDKSDFTIRMDVETGMFEQVLLDVFFSDGGGVSGARVSGARVSGARVSGARVSGARVSGARLSGGGGGASD